MTNTTDNPQEQVHITWMPTVAGILSILSGVENIALGIYRTVTGEFPLSIMWFEGFDINGSPLIVFGAVAVTGGAFALRRRIWGMALAGAICALFPPPVSILGILSIVFLALSRNEFTET